MNVYLLIALVIIVLLLVGYVAYLVVSNRQRDMEADLDHLAELLEDDNRE
jgi:hypothetical protein